jgi:hypothetical protein
VKRTVWTGNYTVSYLKLHRRNRPYQAQIKINRI